MKSEESRRWELLERCERARDGKLTPEEEADLETLLLEDPEMRALFARALHLDAELRYDPRLVRELFDASENTVPFPTKTHRKNLLPLITFAAAACLLIGAIVVSLTPSEPAGPPTVATVVKATSCKWGGSTLPTAEGSRVTTGTLELVEGLATLRFDSGAEVVLEAPATLEIIDSMNCRLKRGTLVADVPHQAIGFTVDTKDAKVVDLGTRFGVSADEDGKYLVHVIEGLVEVGHKGEPGMKKVTAEQSLNRGLLQKQLNPEAPDSDESIRWQPDVIVSDGQGWQTISTNYGTGRDAFIQSTKTPRNFGIEPFMRVKNTSRQADLVRKGYIAFDLSKFELSRIDDAEVTLHIEPSDLGFATLVPDSTFRVYGLTDESGDSWEETGITWENAPAGISDGPLKHLPDESRTTLLGTFTVPQGSSRGTRSIGGKALVDFLKTDTNGTVTLIICRDTDETAKNGFVHAFATRENRGNTPPLLRVKLKD